MRETPNGTLDSYIAMFFPNIDSIYPYDVRVFIIFRKTTYVNIYNINTILIMIFFISGHFLYIKSIFISNNMLIYFTFMIDKIIYVRYYYIYNN